MMSAVSATVSGGSGEAAAAAERFFEDRPIGLATFRAVLAVLTALGPVMIRTSRSQVAFVRRRGFAWLWLPGKWLRHPVAEVVLSISLGREDPSPRWKQVVHPTPRAWLHHLEVGDPAAIDDEVRAWLREAYEEGR